MWIPDFVLKLIGREVAKKLDLKEGNMETKKWYKSKTVISAIVTVLIGAYDLVGANLAPQFGWTLPQIPAWIFTILGAIGIYGRVTAETKIG